MKHQTTIVIPVYNEGENIGSALTAIRRDVRGDYVVAVVYDSDEDTTLPALDRWEKENGGGVLRIRNRYGRGVLNAIRTGLETADSEYVIVTMADLSDPPAVMNDMVRKADSEQADIVCGSRYMRGGGQHGGPLLKGLMSRCAGWSLHFLSGLPTHDPTNSFKLYRKSFLDKMTIESTGGFELGLELVVKAWKQGYKVTEVPTEWTDRVQGKSNFKLWKWLPHYLHWYFAALRDGRGRAGGLVRFGCVVLFLLFLLMHITDPRPLFASLESGGLDASWVRVLLHAHRQGFQFGDEVIFTYGPLGYLLFPAEPMIMFLSPVLTLALLLPFSVVFLRKRSFADLAFLFLFTVVSISYYSAYDVFVFLFPMLLWYFWEDEDPWIRYGGIVYSSTMGAFCVVVKFMCAPVIVFSLLLADVMMLKRRKIVLAIPIFLLFLPLIWCFPAQQKLANLYPFLVYSWHVATGYGYAMACSESSPLWVVIVGGSSAAILAAVLLASRGKGFCRSALERICYVMLPVSVLFAVYKYGVVRLDAPHIVLSLCDLALIAVFLSVDSRMGMKWRAVMVGLFVLIEGGILFAFSKPFMYLYLYPYWYLKIVLAVFVPALLMYVLKNYALGCRAWRLFLILLLSVFTIWALGNFYLPRLEQTDDSIARFRKQKPLSADDAVLAGASADCFSHDIRPLFQAGMRYSPRLVFQSYTAYTPLLLRKNASHFEYDSGPDYIFYGEQELDMVLPAAGDSLALLQLMNNYEPVPGRPLLRKKACRPPTVRLKEIGTVDAKVNRWVELPQGERPIWVSIDFRDSVIGSLMKFAVRPAAVMIRLDLEDKRVVIHKIIPENCVVPFLVSPYLQSWAELDSLLAKERKLPRVIRFSVHPVFHLRSKHWDREIGKIFFKRQITVRFYSPEPSPEKPTER